MYKIVLTWNGDLEDYITYKDQEELECYKDKKYTYPN